MSSNDLFIIFFLGVLAFASGIQIGWGIRAVRRGDWVSGGLVLAQGLFIPLLLIILGDQRFAPPAVSYLDFAVVGVIFVGAILIQVWFIPMLVDDLGEETVTSVAWGGSFMVGGAVLWLVASLFDAPIMGAVGGIFFIGLGLLWFVPGLRGAIRQAFGKTPPAPMQKSSTKPASLKPSAIKPTSQGNSQNASKRRARRPH